MCVKERKEGVCTNSLSLSSLYCGFVVNSHTKLKAANLVAAENKTCLDCEYKRAINIEKEQRKKIRIEKAVSY